MTGFVLGALSWQAPLPLTFQSCHQPQTQQRRDSPGRTSLSIVVSSEDYSGLIASRIREETSSFNAVFCLANSADNWSMPTIVVTSGAAGGIADVRELLAAKDASLPAALVAARVAGVSTLSAD